MKKIGILGAGVMGATIAVAMLTSEHHVILYDVSSEILEIASKRISAIFKKSVDLGKISEELANNVPEHIQYSLDVSQVANVDLVIEAVPESMKIKKEILEQVDNLAPEETILTTNTSSFSINVLANATSRPHKFIGLHFFNPAHIMPLVEIIPCDESSQETISDVRVLVNSIGKTPVESRDLPGFIVNRVARPFYGEAFRLLGEDAASVEKIDTLMKSVGFPMGPFELIDLVGCDVNLAVTKSIYNSYFQDPRYRPHPIQNRMVESGRLGRKTRRGFYKYE